MARIEAYGSNLITVRRAFLDRQWFDDVLFVAFHLSGKWWVGGTHVKTGGRDAGRGGE